MNFFKKKIFVFVLGVCLMMTVLSLPLLAGNQEGQEGVSTAAVQENENEDSLPADLKQMIAFKTKAGGDLKIKMLPNGSVIVSFVEPADPARAEELSRIDTSDLPALYQILTGRSDVPGDVLCMQDIITANKERQRFNSKANPPKFKHNEYGPKKAAQNGNGLAITTDAGCPYYSNKYTKASFTQYFNVYQEKFGYPYFFNVDNEPNCYFQHYFVSCEPNDAVPGSHLQNYVYVNRVCKLNDYVTHKLELRSALGYWKEEMNQKLPLGYLGCIGYFDNPYHTVRLTVDPHNSSFYYQSFYCE